MAMQRELCACGPQSIDVWVRGAVQVESLHSGLHSVTAHSACSNKWIPYGSVPKGAEEGDEWWQYIQQVLEGEDGKAAEDGPVRNLEGHAGGHFSEPINHVTDVKVVELNHHGEPITHEHLQGEWGHGASAGTLWLAGSNLESLSEQQFVEMAPAYTFMQAIGVSVSGRQMISTCGIINDMTCGATRREAIAINDDFTSLCLVGSVTRAFESVCPVVVSNPTPEPDYYGMFMTWLYGLMGDYGGYGQ